MFAYHLSSPVLLLVFKLLVCMPSMDIAQSGLSQCVPDLDSEEISFSFPIIWLCLPEDSSQVCLSPLQRFCAAIRYALLRLFIDCEWSKKDDISIQGAMLGLRLWTVYIEQMLFILCDIA